MLTELKGSSLNQDYYTGYGTIIPDIVPEPGGEGEPGLVRPLAQRRHHHRAPRLAREREEDVGSRSEQRRRQDYYRQKLDLS